ncbi:MAG TPA: propionyl-CoA synthetase [Gammaproteobacteria bacterium]|nr:propionyl-CoA synthetase [Xanthomonadales bacterium]MCB1593299.1 propionyl-CoA synthetase [Xanthomonadales bacterium]HOP22971.1 propionyl-CoA synthetase [Gammaproteobacteria bacterium]HPI95364.1 propionyl-CoA synthetase [Gammaproteobacteria bacterium]HPQ86598.1 propionyl-CoA synthetase [Gammaproteobacteria bacterium]
MQKYLSVYRESIENKEQFWSKAAEAIDWSKPWNKVLNQSNSPFNLWFEGGRLNTCYNALDRHVKNGLGETTALIYDSPVTNTKKSYTYSKLTNKVSVLAGTLKDLGIEKGDRVIIYMPMIPEAIMSMLACARIGAIHSVVFGGFAAKELATRIDDAQPKLIISASCGIEISKVIEYKPLLDKAIEIAEHKPQNCLILQRPQARAEMMSERDLDWTETISNSTETACVDVEATDPLYILYTSGTTGKPKGVVRDNGGHAVALKWSMENIYNIKPGEVFWAASDVGWVVGHSYICYGPLLNGSTTLVYEGKPIGTPDAGAFWRVISEHKVKSMFTAPTAFRAIRKQDQDGEFIKKYDLSHFESLFLAGERCDPDTLQWAEEKLQVPVIDHWWQTETGWAIAANCLGIEKLPVKSGSPTVAVPGYSVDFLDGKGNPVESGQMGNIVVKLPLPPGTLKTLWNDDERLIKSYFSTFDGYYLTGDAGYRDEDGYIYVMGRTDDVINVAGHRLSTGAMEEVLSSHPAVAECAVIGAKCELKGQLPIGLIVTKDKVDISNEQLVSELIALVRKDIGPVAAFKNACVVKRLPKTRSGKILRSTIRSIADGENYNMPATIDDPLILDEISVDLQIIGYPTDS